MNALSMKTCLVTRTASRSRSSLRVNATTTEPASTPKPKPSPKKEFAGGLAGSSGPFKDFDPLRLSNKASDNKLKLWREAELTHSRVAMVASVGFITAENLNPLFNGKITGPAIGHFQQMPTQFWVVILGAIGIVEFARLSKGWVNPAEGKGLWQLKEDYEPGSIGWDPLNIKPKNAEDLKIMQTRELNNGRLAMFGIAGMVAQEEITGSELFNLKDDGLINVTELNCVLTTAIADLDKCY